MNTLKFDPVHCTLCPRKCGGDRTKASGRCRMPAEPLLARAALHRWEEPPISGTRGAGTVFFSGCSLGCVFCQNYEISQEDRGKPVTANRLREIFRDLLAAGAHNIDLVNPTHYAHVVAEVLEEPLPVPVVWNSGGYDRVETLKALEGKIQIFLPSSIASPITKDASSISAKLKGETTSKLSERNAETAASSSIPLETSKKATNGSISNFSLMAPHSSNVGSVSFIQQPRSKSSTSLIMRSSVL